MLPGEKFEYPDSVPVHHCTHRFGLPDLASSHWVHSLCLGYFVCVRWFSCIISACMLYYWGESG